MKKVIFSSLLFGAAMFTYSCTQEFTPTEVQVSKEIKPKKEEMGKYNYSKVVLAANFTQAAPMLLQDNQFSNGNSNNGLFNFSKKTGDVIEILSVTDAKADLGRVLFYDTKMSLNNAVSCGSCHFQKFAFADGKALSPGFEGRMTTRNAMAIVNPAMSHVGLFWDTRSNCVKNLALEPVKNHIEMGMEDLKILTQKLAAIDYYPALFEKAYGSPVITEDRIAEGLNGFIRSFVSWDSKYDQGQTQQFSNFTAEEKHGMKLFNDWNGANCASCHNDPTFDQLWGNGANIGLDKVSKDKGINGSNTFKVPTLRNIELTGPYMHDGRFKTLEEVVDHYSDKVQMNDDLDWNLRDGNQAKKLKLTPYDKKAVVAFLKTLTDQKFISDPKFSDPFDRK
jgi:cytochrome c peroxidase